MENATDALKIAFAVMIFVMALTVSIVMFSQLNTTSKIVLSGSDITKFYEYEEASNQKNRVVGLETIIPTLYKYYKENYTVIFLKSDGTPLPLYKTQTNKTLWGSGTINLSEKLIGKYYKNNSDDNPICAFDVDEETIRHEPWTGSLNDYKKNIDCFLNGEKFYYPSGAKNNDGSVKNYNYKNELGTGGFIGKYAGKQFYEMIGEYSYNVGTDEEQYISELLKGRKKRVIIYQLTN